MSFDPISPGPNKIQVESYPISIELKSPIAVGETSKEEMKELMKVKCRTCRKIFDTTFTVEDFESLPRDQIQSGTLHLCPYCGDLSLYMLKDYFENH